MTRSREEHAAEILRAVLGLEVDIPDAGARPDPTLYCYDPDRPLTRGGDPGEYDPNLRPGLLPNALVRRPLPGEAGWGVLAPGSLQSRLFAALNGRA